MAVRRVKMKNFEYIFDMYLNKCGEKIVDNRKKDIGFIVLWR